MKNRKVLLVGLGILSLLGYSGKTVLASSSVEIKNQVTPKEVESVPQIKTSKKFIPPFIGGVQMQHIGGGGIPPHIYGQSVVKRGTHKRSNRK